MKVAFFSYMALNFGGGLEEFLIQTSRGLAERYPDLEVSVVTCSLPFAKRIHFWHGLYFGQLPGSENVERKSTESVLKQLGAKVHYEQVGNFSELRKTLTSSDVIYSKNELVEAFILKFIVGYHGLPPVVFGCHTQLNYPSPESLTAKLHNILYKGKIYQSLAANVASFHALTESDVSVLRQLFPHKSVDKIANPFDFAGYRSLSQSHGAKIAGLDSDKTSILWVGRLVGGKGLDELEKIISEVNAINAAGTHWYIAGDGPEKAVAQRLDQQSSNVSYLGHVDSGDIPSLYRQCDIFLSTSKRESFPTVLMEAQCFGLPVVAFDIPGSAEIIESGKNGYLVSDTNEFVARTNELIRSHPFSRSFIQEFIGRRFNQDEIYDELRGVLENALAETS